MIIHNNVKVLSKSFISFALRIPESYPDSLPSIMGAVTVEEIASLQREFDWVLTTEVSNVIKELKAAVMVCRIILVICDNFKCLGVC